ncbi:MAG: hypothetical protein V4693_12900 [Pseudomonadota bacterium]
MQKISSFNRLAFLALLVGITNLANAEPNSETPRKVAGVYNLQGVREMAATLILHPDKRFEYGAIYGGADPKANGKWSIEDEVIHLVSEQRAPKYTNVEQSSEPLPDITDGDGIRPALAVQIATPSLDLKWRGVKVAFKFSNGSVRNGMTDRRGVVYLGAHPEPARKGVTLQEVGIALPDDSGKFFWIVPSNPNVTRIAVEFDPGAMAQAFREGYLEIEEGSPTRLVAGRLLGELRGTYVWNGPIKSELKP